MSNPPTSALLNALKRGSQVDVSLSGGRIRSSKIAYAVCDVAIPDKREYRVLHTIDGTITCFTEVGISQVLRGKRSPWDGDV